MLRHYLMYAGILPFITFIGLSLMEGDILGLSATKLFVYYSVLITNFVLGTLWHHQSRWLAIPVSLWTNVLACISFFALLLPIVTAIFVLVFCYIMALFLELQAPRPEEKDAPYLRSRIIVTSCVLLCHFVILLINIIV